MLNNQRGFMLLSVVFLTLVVSFAGMVLLNANVKVQQRNSTLYLTAMNLANEQFAEIESHVASKIKPESNFMGNLNDLKSLNGVREDRENSEPVKFDVETSYENIDENLLKATVTVRWHVGGEEKFITAEKIIRAR